LLPVLERIARQYAFGKPVVIVDGAMLSHDNLDALDRQEYLGVLRTIRRPGAISKSAFPRPPELLRGI